MMLRIIVIFALLAISAWAGDTACDTITAQKTCLAAAEVFLTNKIVTADYF